MENALSTAHGAVIRAHQGAPGRIVRAWCVAARARDAAHRALPLREAEAPALARHLSSAEMPRRSSPCLDI